MNSNRIIRKIAYLLMVSTMFAATACGSVGSGRIGVTSDPVSTGTGFVVTKAGMYDSADNGAVLVKKNTDEKTVTFYNNRVSRKYTLKYDGTSKIYDKYGTGMSMEQVEPGCVVDITFIKAKRILNSMSMSSTAWQYDRTDEFSIDEKTRMMSVNGNNYIIRDNVFVYSNGKQVSLMDINPVDKISVCGLDNNVCSITIDEGHGYLRLKNEDYFVGGWIEIGSKIIKTINDNMIIAVPMGTYDVKISNAAAEGIKSVTITQNQETTLDVGDIKTEELAEFGTVIIVVDPEKAEVFIDGDQIKTNEPQKLEYGIHQLIARATGYQTLTQYIKVGQESATLEIELDKEIAPITPTPKITEEPLPMPSPTPVPLPTAAPSTEVVEEKTIEGFKVRISDPAEVEIYVDGCYAGITPITFPKVSGKHEIILRKEGYMTRSYTITLDALEMDETFSFADLQKE